MVKTAAIILLIGLCVLGLVALTNSMSKPIGHDEHMYCTAAALMAEGKIIYKDFSYVGQLPYHPTICAGLYKVFNNCYFLLIARCFSAACDILVIVLIAIIFCILLKDVPVHSKLLGLGAATLYVFNPIVDYANGFSWNHDFVTLCILLSFVLFITTDFQKEFKFWRIALIGVLLTLASWSRMTAAPIYILFLIAIWNRFSGAKRDKIRFMMPFLAASMVISVWPLVVFFMAPKSFIINVFIIPIYNGEWQRQLAGIQGSLQVIINTLTKPAYIILFALILYFFITFRRLRKDLKQPKDGNFIFSIIIIFILFIIVLIPPAMFEQYFARPALFIIISLVFPFLHLNQRRKSRLVKRHFDISCAVFAIAVTLTILFNTGIIKRLSIVSSPRRWTPIILHDISEDIADKTKEPKRMLTLAPLYAIEGGGEIYPEFSAGPFVYRIGDYLKPKWLSAVTGTGVKGLDELVAESPPSAVILGTEPPGLEEPIYQAVVKEDWRMVNYPQNIVAYFKP